MKQHRITIKKSFCLIHEIDRQYAWLLFLRTVVLAALPLYLSFCISFLVTELAGKRRIEYIGGLLVLLMAGAAAGKWIGAVLEWNCSARYMKIQDAFTAKSSTKAMKMEFLATEDTEIQDLYVHAWQANLAAGTILEKVFAIAGYLGQMIGCVGVILGLEPLLIGFLLLIFALFYLLEYQRSILERQYAEETVPTMRAIDYTRQCMRDSACAKDIRLYYPEDFFTRRLLGFQRERLAKERKKEYRCGGLQTLQAGLQMIQTIVLYLVLASRFLQGTIPIGYVSLAVSSVAVFSKAVEGISISWNQMLKYEVFLGYLERFWELPEPKSEIETEDRAGTLCEEKRKHKSVQIQTKRQDEQMSLDTLEFRHVWFRYPGAVEFALKDVNMTLDGKEVLTLVGENGSGKTTFVKLLLRLYRPTKGEIFLNGIPAENYSDREYQRIFAPVFQDYQLFAYSLEENLLFERSCEKQKIREVLKELRLLEKLDSLPKGLEQCIGKGYEKDGIELSGGERQKLAIARAILKESPCLVLDEPTAALDPISEVELYQKIHQMADERACVFITHRLAGIRFSNQILYFQDGSIAEQGSYQELMEEGRAFREFYQMQARLYEEI